MAAARVSTEKVLLDADAISRTLSRIAHELIEANPELDRLALIGIHTRGVPLAHRLRRLIAERTDEEVELGSLDITFYRDDLTPLAHAPIVKRTDAMPEIGDRTVVLVDDVLFTGRTVRAALDALTDHGLVHVRLTETDGTDEVVLEQAGAGGASVNQAEADRSA